MIYGTKAIKKLHLLGQNVDSYLWYGGGLKKDFDKATDIQKATAVNFSNYWNYVPRHNQKCVFGFQHPIRKI